jgi:hypothetical protein
MPLPQQDHPHFVSFLQLPGDPLIAAMQDHAKSDPKGSLVILVGMHRPPGEERRLVRADPADQNNSRFNLLELIQGKFAASEEKE